MTSDTPRPSFPAERGDEGPLEDELTVDDHPADDSAVRGAAVAGAAGGAAAGDAAGALAGQGGAFGVMAEAADDGEVVPEDELDPEDPAAA